MDAAKDIKNKRDHKIRTNISTNLGFSLGQKDLCLNFENLEESTKMNRVVLLDRSNDFCIMK